MARTQQQRREDTIAALLDAGIAAIVEVGYARASAAEITKRAGVSVGALFRHFDTMGDFMAAIAQEVLRRQVDLFEKQVAEIPADRPVIEAMLTILRDITRGPTNAVLYELMIAARTDEKLRATFQEVLVEYEEKIFAVVRTLPATENVPLDTLAAVIALLTNTFDGAAILRAVAPQPELDAQQIPLIAMLLTRAYGQPAAITTAPPG